MWKHMKQNIETKSNSSIMSSMQTNKQYTNKEHIKQIVICMYSSTSMQ